MTRRIPTLILTLLASVALAACGGADDSRSAGSSDTATNASGKSEALNLVAYSTPEVVYDEIVPDFQKTPEGSGVEFKSSFGASGEQSRAVEAGLPADVVSFSIEPDMERLVDADLVDAGWKRTPAKGLVTTSVVSFIVRKGNPKNIRTWDDLLKPGIKVVTPNPFTSGAAKWNLLGAFGAGGGGAEDPEAGLQYVEDMLENVVAQDKSGRDALQNFLGGNGDVLLSYEYEAITANKQGEELEYVIPDDTIKINIDIATTEEAPEAAQAFVDFALGDEAQELFASWGYRPVNEKVLKAHADEFPVPSGLFTIDDVGGWDKVNTELFDVEGGAIAKIEEEAGVSTAG